ncbi:28429_t:CDS:2, partial [Dentiscutata erythropus]
MLITTISTITGDYAILNVNSSLAANNTSSLTTLAGLYMTTIPYNQSVSNDQVLLYQLTLPNLTFVGLYCDIAPNDIGYICIIEISHNETQSTYIKVKFLTSASVTKIDLLSHMPDRSKTGITSQGLGMQAMAFGGYIFYAMNQNYNYYIWAYDENNNFIEQVGGNKIIPFITAAAVNAILYLASRSNKPVPDKYKQMLNTATAGLFTASHTSLSSIFSFQDVNNYPVFSLSRGFNGNNLMNLILIVLTLYNSETLLLINQSQLKEMFGGKEFEATAKYRGFADILLKSIPQLITQ